MGKTAVTRIPFSKGVCGACARTVTTMLVPNVHEFPGHIACDAASNSEIVVPVLNSEGRLMAVMDLDSPIVGGFSTEDQAGLENISTLLGMGSEWGLAGGGKGGKSFSIGR
jgi:L-methionine (R)-S-oxide reductase